MRLPWWPIYVDTRFDEQGVYYAIDDEPEQLVPWHQIRFYVQNKYLVFAPEDEYGKQQQTERVRLFLRTSIKGCHEAAEQATEFQKAYLNNPENQYTCKVNQRAFVNDKLIDIIFLGVFPIGLSAYFLFMMIQGYNSVPDNEHGIRYQNGILIGAVSLILFTFFVVWRSCKGLRRQQRATKIIEINQLGIVTDDAQYPWDALERIDQGFTDYVVTTISGKHLRVPANCCARLFAHQRISHPPVLSRTLFVLCLIGSVLSGPIFSAWFGYLVPDYEQPFNFWGVSLMLTGAVLAIFGAIYFMIWQSKRQASKSQ